MVCTAPYFVATLHTYSLTHSFTRSLAISTSAHFLESIFFFFHFLTEAIRLSFTFIVELDLI